jgi:hypothetical protein
VSGAAAGAVVAGGSAGAGDGVDLGCHFLRSGVAAIGAEAAVSVGIGGLTGDVSEIEDDAVF